MENRAVFLESAGEIPTSKQAASEFLLLYQQSVLLALQEQGVLDERQYGFCLDALGRQMERNPHKTGGEL